MVFEFQFPCDADWEVIVQLLGVGATIFVSFVALFQDWIKYKLFYKNPFKIEFEKKPHKIETIKTAAGTFNVVNYRIKISKNRKWLEVLNCSVELINITIKDDSGETKLINIGIENELKWSSVRIQHYYTKIDDFELLDLFHIHCSYKILKPSFFDHTVKLDDKISGPCSLEFNFQIKADKIGSMKACIGFKWDGQIPKNNLEYNGIEFMFCNILS